MKNENKLPTSILIGLGLVAYAIYLGLTVEYRNAFKGCDSVFQGIQEKSKYDILISDCISKKLNPKD